MDELGVQRGEDWGRQGEAGGSQGSPGLEEDEGVSWDAEPCALEPRECPGKVSSRSPVTWKMPAVSPPPSAL